MPDEIGRIEVPTVAPSGTFPLMSEYPHGQERDYRVVVHEMDNTAANLKIEQRFLLGTGSRRFLFQRSDLIPSEKLTLQQFYDDHRGPHVPFTYNAPDPDGDGTTAYTCVFANEPLVFEMSGPASFSVQCTLLEFSNQAVVYGLEDSLLRFPDSTLAAALLGQAQELIPLVHIVVKESGHPDNIFLSNRRVTIGDQAYLPRLVEWSEISQGIGGESDVARFTFGNADRVMSLLAEDTVLRFADIEFSLFHTATEIKLDVWKGQILRCSGHNKDLFQVEAVDSLDMGILYPLRQISRSCWKVFNDGLNCTPPVTSGPCDKTFDGTDGCAAHENERQFGGQLVRSEIVRIRNTGKGAGRALVSAASLVQDTAFGKALPEHYADVPMKVRAEVVAGREESDFFIGQEIVGQGPVYISRNAFDHKLDGQSPHGPGVLGFRASNGPDPAEQSDGIFPEDNDHYFNLDESTWPPANPIFAAGTAFVTHRRADERGVQIRPVTDHEAIVTLLLGLGGHSWGSDTSGSERGTQDYGLVNPVWIAINMLLRAKQIYPGSAEQQEALFDVEGAVAAGSIAATVVDKLIGSGTETQYRFVGTVGEQKPLRDWIQIVMNSCLGYWSWVFGKLFIGMRVNSSVEQAFTAGNIIRGSLELQEIEPEFNTLTVQFNDEEFDFAENSVTVELEEHVKLYGRRIRQMLLPGVCSKSQALRIAATRLREECGGKDIADWKKARTGSFATTVLGLGTAAGMICSLTHGDMPGGAGEFRLHRWTLYPDMSLKVDWKTTVDSMYDLTIGPKPADVLADPLPVERIEESVPVQPWFPGSEDVDLAIDPVEQTFAVTQQYEQGADASATAKVVLRGRHPVTRPLDLDPPRIGSLSVDTASGSLLGGLYVTVIITATNDDGETRASKAMAVQIPAGTDTNRIVLSDIVYPPGTAGYRIYAAVDRGLMSRQKSSSGSQPSSINLDAIPYIRTSGFPQPQVIGLRIRQKECIHAGVNGFAVTGVGEGTITLAGAGWTTDEWIGRTVRILADQSDGSAPAIWHFEVLSNDGDTLTVDPDPEGQGVEAGDVATIETLADVFSADTIGDSKFQNAQYPAGLTPNAENGLTVFITRGTGAGQERLIVSHDETTYTVSSPFDPEPAADSSFRVEAAGWERQSEVLKVGGDSKVTYDGSSLIYPSIEVPNIEGRTVLIEVATVDRDGKEPERRYNPSRLIYLFGDPGGTLNSIAVKPLYIE